MRWHRHSVKDVLAQLDSSRQGLSAEEARRRLTRHGPNRILEPPPPSRLALLAAQFLDVPVLVLIAAALISGVVGDFLDTLVIVAIVALNAVIGFLQEYRAERALAALKAMTAPTAVALRDGEPAEIPAEALVPGDIVLVEAGRVVPADLRLIEAAALTTNEAALTGESIPVDKTAETLEAADLAVGERRNLLHKGTYVTRGRATGVVIATGDATEFGRIAALLREASKVRTPLQNRLARFGRSLAAIVLVICAIVFLAGLLRGESLLPMFMTALSLAVAAIPEALPAVVTMALALGARTMIARQVLIRRLPAVETLGSVTFICTDKTGTLTVNEMRVSAFYCQGELAASPKAGGAWEDLLRAMAISHDAAVDAQGRILGDPLEAALLRAARAAGLDEDSVGSQYPRIAEIPFDARRKCMTTFHATPYGGVLAVTKGAPEILLERAESVGSGDEAGPVDERVRQVVDAMAREGMRVIAIGQRHWPAMPLLSDPEVVERGLTLVGLVGLIDPPRAGARDAVAQCRRAGIEPVMITGDHPLTALAIARQLDLSTDEKAVMTGPELAAASPQELQRRVGQVRVYARVSPEQKLRIVTALQDRGECVAMTGDGVNDAPALRRADIGVAMGRTGTDVAREASAMVLLDDNFASIVRAVREGRRIYDNLRRFVRYQVTTNSAEVWTLLLAPFLGLPVPLLPIQILWINLVSDGLPGLALALEPAERDIMLRPPRPPRESIFARGLGAHVLWVGIFMAALTLGVQAWLVSANAAAAHWQTMTLTMLCFVQMGHVLGVRSERQSLWSRGILTNKPLLGAILLAVALQLLIIYSSIGNRLFGTAPLAPAELAIAAAGALLVLVAVETEKWVRRRRPAPGG